MADLTPEEQQFFASGGDVSHLNLNPEPGIQGVDDLAPPAPPTPAPAPVDPLALAGLGNVDPPTAPAPAAPAPAPVVPPAPPPDAMADILRRTLVEAQANAAALKAQLDAATAPKPPPAAPVPDPETDPLGNMIHQLNEVNKNVTDLQTRLNNQQAQQTQLREFQQFQQNVVSLRDQFKVVTPDFDEAYTHLREARMADLRLYGVPEADIPATLFKEEVQLSQQALVNQKNPAETIYEMARRHGYVAKTAPPAPAPAPGAAPAAPAPSTAKTKLTAIQKNAQQQPLPKVPAVEEYTPESLKDASDADLNKLVQDPAAWAKIAGTNSTPI